MVKSAKVVCLEDQGEYDSMGAAAIAALSRRFGWVDNHDWCVSYDEYYVISSACEDGGMWIEEQSEGYEPATEGQSRVYQSATKEDWAYGWNEQIGWGGFPTEAHAIAAGITQLFTLLRDAGVALPANTDQERPAFTTDVPGLDEAQSEQEST
jgi:hypothetical protein